MLIITYVGYTNRFKKKTLLHNNQKGLNIHVVKIGLLFIKKKYLTKSISYERKNIN